MGSVNHNNKLALWLGKKNPHAAIAGFNQFPQFFNAHLLSIPNSIIEILALNGSTDAQFIWALQLLEQHQADTAKVYWQPSVAKQPDKQRLQLANLLMENQRWHELAHLATQELIPSSDTFDLIKLNLGYPAHAISHDFAKRSDFSLSTADVIADTHCEYNVLMMTDHYQGLTKLKDFKQRYITQPEPRRGAFCFSTPLYLGSDISCQNNPKHAASCDWQALISKVQWPKEYDFIVMMPRTGKGNVRSGIMQLGSQSHYGLFLHELMHFNGFEDEYALPIAKQAWLCKQTGYVAPNLFIANNIAPPEGWHVSQSCQGRIKAYKPSDNWSIMQYQQLALSAKYRALWSAQINNKQQHPLRFADYFSKVSGTVNFIDKMTNNHNTE